MPVSTKNIVLFGQTGAGKSSLVNLMAGEQVAETSPGTERCTLQWKDFSIEINAYPFRVFDTIGLEEYQLGMKEYLDAIVNAYNLITKLDEDGGIDLLLFCVRAGRFTSNILNNYRLFYESLCEKKVPIVLVLTGLETEQNMGDWWTRYNSPFNKYGIKIDGHACITAVNGLDERHQKLYEESRRLVRELVIEHTHGGQNAYKEGKNEEGNGHRGGDKLLKRLLHMLKERLAKGTRIPKKKEIVNTLHKNYDMPMEAATQLASQIRRDLMWKSFG